MPLYAFDQNLLLHFTNLVTYHLRNMLLENNYHLLVVFNHEVHSPPQTLLWDTISGYHLFTLLLNRYLFVILFLFTHTPIPHIFLKARKSGNHSATGTKKPKGKKKWHARRTLCKRHQFKKKRRTSCPKWEVKHKTVVIISLHIWVLPFPD